MRKEGLPIRSMEDHSEQPLFRLYGSFDVTKSTIDHEQLQKAGKKAILSAGIGLVLGGGLTACGEKATVSAQDILTKPSPTPIVQEGPSIKDPKIVPSSDVAFVDARHDLSENLVPPPPPRPPIEPTLSKKMTDDAVSPTVVVESSPTKVPTEVSPTPETSPTPKVDVRAEIDRLISKGKYNAALHLVDPEGMLFFNLPPEKRTNPTRKQLEHAWVEVTGTEKKIAKKPNQYLTIIAAEPREGNICHRIATEAQIKDYLARRKNVPADQIPEVLEKYKAVSASFWDEETSPIADSYPFMPATVMWRVDVLKNEDSGIWDVRYVSVKNPYMSGTVCE